MAGFAFERPAIPFTWPLELKVDEVGSRHATGGDDAEKEDDGDGGLQGEPAAHREIAIELPARKAGREHVDDERERVDKNKGDEVDADPPLLGRGGEG